MNAAAIEISVPSRPESVRVVRSVANALAAGLNFGFDRIEDLNLAIGEAAAFLVPGTGDISCQLTYGTDHISVGLSGEGPDAPWAGSITEVVVESVASDVSYDTGVVRFTVSR